MNKKKLGMELSKLKHLIKLNVKLEQYETDGELASGLIWMAFQNGDIKDKVVADFGCGSGILGIGALILGAGFVYFLDLDKNALEVCKENLVNFTKDRYKVICSDVSDFCYKVDTVVMNPPFGVQNRKADKVFLETAMKISDGIYSIHKIESKRFIEKLCSENKFNVLGIIEREFILKRSYSFHTKDKHYFKVGIWILKGNV